MAKQHDAESGSDDEDEPPVSPWAVPDDAAAAFPPATRDTTERGAVPDETTSDGSGVGADQDPFAEPAVLRPRDPHLPSGWRGLVQRVTGRRIDGDAAGQAWDADLERCQRAAPGGRRIAVISRKGGVGKTTTTLMIGHTLAAVRQDRVVAIDGNPDAGTLGHRVQRQTGATVLDALDALGTISGYPHARQFTSQAPSRLEVLASPEDPHGSRSLSGRDYQLVMEELGRHYNLVLCDTGTGIMDDAHLGILEAVDQIVVVSGAALDTARAASMTLDWLDEHGGAALVADAVVVVNAVAELGRVDLGQLTQHFRSRTRVVHHVGYDRHLEAGSITDPDRLMASTQQAWLQVAASVADGFALPSPRDTPRSLR